MDHGFAFPRRITKARLLFYVYGYSKGMNRMLHIIYNPIAGHGRSHAARQAIEPLLLKIPHTFHETQYKGHAREIARALTVGSRDVTIVSMGGDGTLNEVLNGVVDPACLRLGVIPCGSGNDFAAAAGISTDPCEALKLLLDGEARPTDYMECSGVRGINAIGAGIDVEILRRRLRMKLLKGSAAYLASLIATVINYRPRRFDVVTETGIENHSALIACVCNGRSIGGGIQLCPNARLDDGLLDLAVIDGISRSAIPSAFVKLMKGRVNAIPGASFSRLAALKILSDPPQPVQIDGEIHEGLPFDVHVVHGSLRVFRP